jgi:hypothetical protein
VEEIKMLTYTNSVFKQKGRYYLRNFGIDGNIIRKWKLEKYGAKMWIGFHWLRMGSNGEFL